jgi:hypothetical protein
MATFAKHGNQSLRGWNDKKGVPRQTLAVGADAEVSLFGSGDKGTALEVVPHDPTICTIHERATSGGAPDWRRFVVTALTNGETWIEARMPAPDKRVFAYLEVEVVGKHGIRLVFFPGERTTGGTTVGTIYVVGGHGESYPAAGGLEIGKPDKGGHTADPTPAGLYTLGPKHHVVTASWPKSVIPWGASLRLNKDGEVEFEASKGKWVLATGSKGEVTKAAFRFLAHDNKKVTLAQAAASARLVFIDPKTSKLRSSEWKQNDFGRWGWNLRLNGQHTAYYIHTTPEDEQATEDHKAVALANSHGCVHLRPLDREDMVSKGYLKEGGEFQVRPYTDRGPP